ncbi:hypothetical protein LTR36_004494 [Oleoguttula mirabilis]|uniref:Uncharacterized protein n=1 Tax=Oleoguttula mirabilis TaxID=1507867 RepID=A0AAV9JGG9_9PEZI|nr:hypothetical protein LTR36_004494 [Oleoguttula mirabilis]
MPTTAGTKTPDKPAAKTLTPAQTAKPYGTAAKTAASRTAAKPAESAPEPEAAKDDVTKAIEKLEFRVKAVYVESSLAIGHVIGSLMARSNANNIARVANSKLATSDEKLYPLLSLKTGKPVEKFPLTSAGIPKLSLTLVDAMLNALDADRTGNEEAKRERLRVQIGLGPKPA